MALQILLSREKKRDLVVIFSLTFLTGYHNIKPEALQCMYRKWGAGVSHLREWMMKSLERKQMWQLCRH